MIFKLPTPTKFSIPGLFMAIQTMKKVADIKK
jgi:hypothetical protein